VSSISFMAMIPVLDSNVQLGTSHSLPAVVVKQDGFEEGTVVVVHSLLLY
jgi:hypothetical protein